jgi:fucose permease
MPAAKHMAAQTRINAMATMAAAYGVGQIAGPLVSNALVAHTHSFDRPLLSAGGALVIGALMY